MLSARGGFEAGLGRELGLVATCATTVARGTNLEPVVEGLRETQAVMVVGGTKRSAAGLAPMDSDLSHVDPAAWTVVPVHANS